MTPAVVKELQAEEKTPLHAKLLELCLADVKRSRGAMSKFYRAWDMQDEVYRGERTPDMEDAKSSEKGQPIKMIVPHSYAQVMTFTSFLFLMFKQNDKFFELKPTGAEDFGTKWTDCESVVDRDWRHSGSSRVLFQNLLDTSRFGLAPLDVTWTKEMVRIFTESAPVSQVVNGVTVNYNPPGVWKLLTKFEGNLVKNVSPYRWFPDPSFPVSEFWRGDFVACEEDFTMGGLKTLEAGGEVAGVKHIQALPHNAKDGGSNSPRGGESRLTFDIPHAWDPTNGAAPVVVTKIRRKLVPRDFELMDSRPLGDEEFQVMYTIWIANDNRIIRMEPSGEWHSDYNSAASQFTPDMHRTVTMGLADLVYPLQDAISWFVNSHITSVRRVIQNRNIVNPAFVETKSYDGEGDIFIRRGVGRIDPKMAVSQLPAADVTGNHMNDVEILGKLMQLVTGVNDNAMGQYNGGRRSASEARVVTAGAAGRMKMHGHLIWEQGLGRIGKMMLSNSRQSLSAESFARAIGGQNPQALAARFTAFRGTPEEIVCGDDYLTFDATLSSEKGYMAQNLQELLSLIVSSNPLAAQMLAMKIDPSKIVSEMQYLRDGTPVERFAYGLAEQQQMLQLQQAQLAAQSQPATTAAA